MAAVIESSQNERCKIHQTEVIQGVCETCDDTVCVKCIMGQHNGHTFTDLEAKVGEKKDSLQDHMLELKRRIPILTQRVAELSILNDKNGRDTDTVVSSIQQKGDSIKSKVESIISTLVANAENQRKDTERKLNQTKSSWEKLIAKGNSFIESVENNIKLSSDLEIIQLEKQCSQLLDQFENDDKITNVSTPKFVPGEESNETLQTMVGCLYSDLVSSLKLMPYVRIDSTISVSKSDTDVFISKICGQNETEAWVRGFKEESAKLFDNKGTLIDSRKITQRCSDFGTTKDGTLLATCPNAHCVWSFSENGKSQISINFRDGLQPISIHVNKSTGQILLGIVDSMNYSPGPSSARMIRRYNSTGEELQTIQFQTKKSFFGRQTQTNIFSYPHRIAENNQSGDIAVIDWNGDFTGELIVLNREGDIKFRFKEAEETFSPWDVTFDVLGYIIVSDRYSRNIQLYKQDGKVRCILHKCTFTPHSVEAFSNGKLWIGHSNGKISIIKYLE